MLKWLIHFVLSRVKRMKIIEIKGEQPVGRGDGVLVSVDGTGVYMGGLKQGFKIEEDLWKFDFGEKLWTKVWVCINLVFNLIEP